MDAESARIWQHAEALYNGGRYDLAEPRFRELVGRLPGHAGPLLLLAFALRFLNRHAEAVMAAEGGVRLAPADAAAHLTLALVHVGGYRPADAVGPATEAVRLAPDLSSGYLAAGMAAHLLGDHAAALAWVEQGLAIDGRSRSLRFVRSLALAAAGRHDAAVAVVADYLAERPDEDALAHAGWAYWHLRRPAEAVGFLERSLAINPRDAWPHEGIGLALYDLGRVEDARRHAAEAVRIDPAVVDARRLLSQIGRRSRGGEPTG